MDPEYQAKYEKYKMTVKMWEHEFKKKNNGRIPSKYDIKEAPLNVKQAYKMYYRMKTSFLENTLIDVLDNDDDFSQSEINFSHSESLLSTSIQELLDTKNSLPPASEIRNFGNLDEIRERNILISSSLTDQESGRVRKFEAEETVAINQNAWGKNLNKKKATKEPPKVLEKVSSKLKLNINPTEIKSLRNPRKSFTRNPSKVKIQSFIEDTKKEVLPDLETLLLQKSRSGNELKPVTNSKPEIKHFVDQGWLDRNTSDTIDEPFDNSENLGSLKTARESSTFGLSGLNLKSSLSSLNSSIQTENKYHTIDGSDDEVIENSEDESSIQTRKILHIAKKRRILEESNRDNGVLLDKSKSCQNFGYQAGSGENLARNVENCGRSWSSGNFLQNSSKLLDDSSDSLKNTSRNTSGSSNLLKNPGMSPGILENSLEHPNVQGNLNIPGEAVKSQEKSFGIQENHSNLHETSELQGKSAEVQENTTNIQKNTKAQKRSSKVLEKPRDTKEIQDSSDSEMDVPLKPKRKPRKLNPPTENPEKSLKPIRQRSTRKPQAHPNYQTYSDEGEDFDGDDSDKDPDFGAKDLKFPNVEEETPVLKRKASIIKKSKESLGKITKKATKLLTRGRKTEKKEKDEESVEEPAQEEKPEMVNYLIDTNLKRIQTVSRVAIKEIRKSEMAFEKYVKTHTQGPRAAEETPADINVKSEMAREKLEKRIASGTLNENFVRVNLKKKVFVRGKKQFNFSRYKKALWKGKKAAALSGPDMDMGGCDGGVLKCFNCGGVGHFAQQCKKKGDALLPLDAEMVDESPFLTLEEAAEMADDRKLVAHARNPDNIPASRNENWKMDESDEETEKRKQESGDANQEPGCSKELEVVESKKSYIGHTIPDDFLKKSGLLELTVGNKDEIEPLYSLNPDNTTLPTTREVFAALRQFGHEKFRPGQEKAIMRILSGVSTLVTLSTGSGKSLCYQLPAYLYGQRRRCITLVISPLVSLMEDQVHGVPGFLNAQCLHTNQTAKQREKTMEAIKSGKVDILLVSPEAVVSGEKSTGFGSLLRQLPPIAFACIDEAHCVSQWSHNFRPSYLMICRVLKEKLGVKTVLGLTATATLQTRTSIVRHLGIPDGMNGIISDIPLPDNLILTVSKDENRDRALIGLLKGDRFSQLKSIIIYCTRRDECERIAGFLRTCMQDEKNEDAKKSSNKRRRINWNAEAYHAGLPASRRRTIQNAFMAGEMRIVVATIAFGMGINKADIRGIIHYNMPKNFESYVQEVGRAGRDGLPAHCHVFLDSRGQDLSELRRHVYANSIDRHVIRKLLQKVFVPCACRQNMKNEEFRKEIEAAQSIDWDEEMDVDTMEQETVKPQKRICPGHEVCFSIENTVQFLDIPEENISTLLCYLELHEQRFIQVLGNAYTTCKIISYGGPKYLKQMAKQCPPLAMAIALDLKNGVSHENSSQIEFNVVDIAAAIGWDSGVVKYQLKQLEWTVVNGANKRSAISVDFSNLGFRIKAPGDLTDEELDASLDLLQERCSGQEKTQLIQLQVIFDALSSVSHPTYGPVADDDVSIEPSEKLKSIIREYFQTTLPTDVKLIEDIDDTSNQEIISDVRSVIGMYPENNFTGRSLARLFHGISSPCFPAVVWGRCKYWRAHTKVSFNRLIQIANKEILKMRS